MLKLHVDNRQVVTISKTSWGDIKKLCKVMVQHSTREYAVGKEKKTTIDHNFEYIGFGMNNRDFSDKCCGVFVDKMQYIQPKDIILPFNKRYLPFPIFTGLRNEDQTYYCTMGFCVSTDRWTLKDFKCFAKCDFIDIYLSNAWAVRRFQDKLNAAGLIDYKIASEFDW